MELRFRHISGSIVGPIAADALKNSLNAVVEPIEIGQQAAWSDIAIVEIVGSEHAFKPGSNVIAFDFGSGSNYSVPAWAENCHVRIYVYNPCPKQLRSAIAAFSAWIEAQQK